MESLEGVLAEKALRLARLEAIERSILNYSVEFDSPLQRSELLAYCRLGIFHYYVDTQIRYYNT